jgi:hypothetical protein
VLRHRQHAPRAQRRAAISKGFSAPRYDEARLAAGYRESEV